MKSIENFEEAAAKILSVLFASFPSPQTLNFVALAGCKEEEVDEFGRMPAAAQHLSDTAAWLADEGFIRAADQKPYYFWGAVLTSQGLKALNAKIETIDPKKPLGEKLHEALILGGKSLLSSVVQAVISVSIRE